MLTMTLCLAKSIMRPMSLDAADTDDADSADEYAAGDAVLMNFENEIGDDEHDDEGDADDADDDVDERGRRRGRWQG